MINLSLEPLVEPTFPADQNNRQLVEIWKEDRKLFVKRREDRRQISSQIFPIVQGQCSPAMRARIEADANWEQINNTCDVIQLLILIRNCEVRYKPLCCSGKT
jgi:hypothetical protein